MLRWLQKLFERPRKEPERRTTASALQVRSDDRQISLRRPDGTTESIAWTELGNVSITTTDRGPIETDLFWILTDKSGRRSITVPMDAGGEHEFLKAMQSRLQGFDNMAVVEAMSSIEEASFVIWEREARA